MYLTFYFWLKMTVEVSLLPFFTGLETCQENLKFDQFPEPRAPSPPQHRLHLFLFHTFSF